MNNLDDLSIFKGFVALDVIAFQEKISLMVLRNALIGQNCTIVSLGGKEYVSNSDYQSFAAKEVDKQVRRKSTKRKKDFDLSLGFAQACKPSFAGFSRIKEARYIKIAKYMEVYYTPLFESIEILTTQMAEADNRKILAAAKLEALEAETAREALFAKKTTVELETLLSESTVYGRAISHAFNKIESQKSAPAVSVDSTKDSTDSTKDSTKEKNKK